MKNIFEHTWCDCLECDEAIAAFRLLIVGRGNRDAELMLALVHHTHDTNTTYHVFGETYHLLHHRGEIQDPQLVDWDEDEDDDEEWDPDDGLSIGCWTDVGI